MAVSLPANSQWKNCLSGLKTAVAKHERLNQALRVGQMPTIAVAIMSRQANAGLDGYFRVVGTDALPLWQVTRSAPQKVVLSFGLAGALEAEHLASLRIDIRHNVLNGTVFACCIHRLKYPQYRLTVRCVTKSSVSPCCGRNSSDSIFISSPK
jgi:hypothetical protein